MKNLYLLALLLPALAFGQKNLLKSGPMLGYAELREVALWAQTTEAATVQFKYREAGAAGPEYATESVQTQKRNAFATTIIADKVLPGKRYDYDLYINKKKVALPYPTQFQTQKLWNYRGDAPTFSVAVGSCFYVNDSLYDRPGKPYGSEYGIMTSIAKAKPDAMLWLGDNVYSRDGDWYTRTGMLYRYSHTRALPQLQPLLASTHNYAIWDDHDYGPNDADRGYAGKADALDIFQTFYPNLNHGLATPTGDQGLTGTFIWGDAQFFLLDDRWFRAPNDLRDPAKPYFGPEQLAWLEDQLVSSHAKFKIICGGGQMISPAAVFENYATYPVEQQKFLEVLRHSEAKGIFLLSGDRHHGELTKIDRPGTYPLYELTTSALTAGVAHPKEVNAARVENTLIEAHNFALLSFSGPNTDRVLKISMRGTDGQVIWERELHANELK